MAKSILANLFNILYAKIEIFVTNRKFCEQKMDEILAALREKRIEVEMEEMARQEDNRKKRELEYERWEREKAAKKIQYTICNEHVISHMIRHINAKHIDYSAKYIPSEIVGVITHDVLISDECEKHIDFEYITSNLGARFPKIEFHTKYTERTIDSGFLKSVNCYLTEKKGWLW